MDNTQDPKKHIQRAACRVGFASCRITTADPVSSDRLMAWIEARKHGGMRYMARNPQARCDPRSLMPEARSVICCALPYGEHGILDHRNSGPRRSFCADPVGPCSNPRRRTNAFDGRERVRARFARGADYHGVVKDKLRMLADELKTVRPDAKIKCCVDTSPILEKALAARAGMGWIGKHTLLLSEEMGSWFVLGEIITSVALEPDAPLEDRCGPCRTCVEACPAGALSEYTLDARACISYLTVECGRGRGYGCDVCQEACPFNAPRR